MNLRSHSVVRARAALVCACLCAFLWACGSPADAGGGDATGASFSQPGSVAEPTLAQQPDGAPRIDTEQAAHGYVIASASSEARLKFQVTNGEQTYNHDLPNDGTQEVFPINMGDGTYTFRIMQNTTGSDYVELCSATKDVVLESEFAPFLVPNRYCLYDASSACVAKAREVTADASNMGEAVRDVCEFVAQAIAYDNDKARELSSATGYVPDPDRTLAEGSGICFDYASLSCAMLRSLGIPTKLVTGYVGADQIYHSWIMVYVDGSWHTAQFRVDPNTWSRCDVTFAATGPSADVGDASAYADRYVY